MNTTSILKRASIIALMIASTSTFISCDKDDDIVPEAENDLEVITDVKLIFTNDENPEDIVEATAKDEDGIGVEELVIKDAINLDAEKTYVLTYTIENHLAEEEEEEDHEDHGDDDEHGDDDHGDDDEHAHEHGFDIAEEIAEEGAEHQIFYSFTDGAFSDPLGNGNIDNASDPINYNDTDANGNNLGLETTWTTRSASLSEGTFTVRLQHQPDVKTNNSGATDGDTDFELTFVLNINQSNIIVEQPKK